TEPHARLELRGPFARHLALGVGAYVGGGGFHGSAEFRGERLAGRAQFGGRDASALAFEAIELARIFHERAIAAAADGFENRPHHGFGFGESGGLRTPPNAALRE